MFLNRNFKRSNIRQTLNDRKKSLKQTRFYESPRYCIHSAKAMYKMIKKRFRGNYRKPYSITSLWTEKNKPKTFSKTPVNVGHGIRGVINTCKKPV